MGSWVRVVCVLILVRVRARSSVYFVLVYAGARVC